MLFSARTLVLLFGESKSELRETVLFSSLLLLLLLPHNSIRVNREFYLGARLLALLSRGSSAGNCFLRYHTDFPESRLPIDVFLTIILIITRICLFRRNCSGEEEIKLPSLSPATPRKSSLCGSLKEK